MGRHGRVVGSGNRKYALPVDMEVIHRRASPGMEQMEAQVFSESGLAVRGSTRCSQARRVTAPQSDILKEGAGEGEPRCAGGDWEQGGHSPLPDPEVCWAQNSTATFQRAAGQRCLPESVKGRETRTVVGMVARREGLAAGHCRMETCLQDRTRGSGALVLWVLWPGAFHLQDRRGESWRLQTRQLCLLWVVAVSALGWW